MAKKKIQHIAMVPSGTPIGTPARRLCDRKKTVVKGWHWDRSVCPACVTAMARRADHQPTYTWVSVQFSNNATATSSQPGTPHQTTWGA